MSDTEELNLTLKETIEEISNDELSGDEGTSTKNIQKPKKPRTKAQMEALEKAQKARKLKALQKKEEEDRFFEDSQYLKTLTKKQRQMLKQMAIAENEENEEVRTAPIQKRTRQPKIIYEDDPSSDEEVVIVKRRPKPKKKKKPKKVVYEDEYSDEDTEDEEIVKEIQKPKTNKIEKVKDEIEEQFDEEYYYEPQPLTYSSIGRFL
jgi:hypothetical protein